jgi:hypothetical protein|tara:strand:+ start:40 stop:555 length:516 start_codon:yes stop_codon:yes gene_type:complete
MAEVMPEEQELFDRAAEVDSTKEAAIEAMSPEGKFSMPDLNSLVDALNKVLPMFERPMYPEFSEDIDGILPTEFVKSLDMVATAAESSGLERLSWDISTAKTDGDLEAIEARLDTLSTNQPFITWLKTDTGTGDTPAAPEMPASVPPPQAETYGSAPPSTPDMEALLASRV